MEPTNKLELVPFQGGAIEAVMHEGQPYVVLKRVCENLGIAEEPQQAKLKGMPWATTTIIVAVAADGRSREMLCMDLDTFLMWLATINPGKVAEEARPALVAYQCGAKRVLADHFLGRTSGAAQVAALQAEMQRMKAEVAELGARSAQVPALVGAVKQLQAGAGRRNAKAERQLQQLTLTLQAQAAQPARRPDAMAAAKAYLLAALQAGPVRATEVEAGAKAVGVSGMTLRRARDKMQIKSFRCGGIGAGGHWWWSLPPVGGAS